MSKHSIKLKRVKGSLSSQTIGTDALSALVSIPGVKNPEIISELDELVELTYTWEGEGKFLKIEEHLKEFYLTRSDEETKHLV